MAQCILNSRLREARSFVPFAHLSLNTGPSTPFKPCRHSVLGCIKLTAIKVRGRRSAFASRTPSRLAKGALRKLDGAQYSLPAAYPIVSPQSLASKWSWQQRSDGFALTEYIRHRIDVMAFSQNSSCIYGVHCSLLPYQQTRSIYSVLRTITVEDGDPCIEETPNFVPCPDRRPWHGSCHAQRPSSASQVARINGRYLTFKIGDLPDTSHTRNDNQWTLIPELCFRLTRRVPWTNRPISALVAGIDQLLPSPRGTYPYSIPRRNPVEQTDHSVCCSCQRFEDCFKKIARLSKL
ncbi:hypothetical protein BDV10DRAFT_40579 [Aspergillus recurvatus]